MAGGNVHGQKFGALVPSQKVGINILEASASNEVIDVDVGFADDIADGLDLGVVMVAEEAEALSASESQFSFDSGVELIDESLELDNELNVESGAGLGLLEENDLHESVDVAGIQMHVDGNQELLKSEDGQTDSPNFIALSLTSGAGNGTGDHAVHEERIIVQEVRRGSSVKGNLEVRLALHKSYQEGHRDHGLSERSHFCVY